MAIVSEENINLLQPQSNLSPQLTTWVDYLRQVSYISLVILLVLGVVVASLFLFLRFEDQSLSNQKVRYQARLQADSPKEASLTLIKDRLALARQVISKQTDWGVMMGTVSNITQQPKLRSVTVDENGKVILTLQTTAMDDALAVTNAILGLNQSKKLQQPQLVSFSLGKDGVILLSVGFVPIF